MENKTFAIRSFQKNNRIQGTKKEPIIGTIPERCFPLRLWYMYHDEICSVIDVDEKNSRIKLYNFTYSYLKRAFGRNSEPNCQDYRGQNGGG